MKIIKFISIFFIMCSQLIFGISKVSAQTLNIDQLQAKALMLVNASNGQVLYAKNEEELIDVGALSKLILVYLIYHEIEIGNMSLSDKVPISNAAYELSQDYDIPNVPLRQDFEYTVEELLETVALRFANGSALALAELLTGSQKDTVKKMNYQLQEWGLENNQLINVTGLSEGSQVNKLNAEALMTTSYRLLNDYPEYLELTKIKDKVFKARTDDSIKLTNANNFIDSGKNEVRGTDGLGVSYSESLGYSYVLTTNRDEERLIAIALGTSQEEIEGRFVVQQLIDYGFASFETRTILMKGNNTDQIPEIRIFGGDKNVIQAVYKNSLTASIPLGNPQLKMNYQLNLKKQFLNEKGEMVAPIMENQVIGTVKVAVEGTPFRYLPTSSGDFVEIVAAETIEEQSFFGRFLQGSADFISGAFEGARKFFTDLFN